MEKNNKHIPPDEKQGIITVTPIDSPSGNYLVEEHLQRMPNIFARGLFYIIILLLVVTLIYTYLAKVDVVAECRSVVRPASHIIRILSDRNGYIERVYVAEGEYIKKGMPLFYIRSKEAVGYTSKVDELLRTIPLQEQYFDMQISVVKDRLKQRENQNRNTLKILRLKLDQNRLSFESIESDIEYWENQVKILAGEAERTKNGVSKGYMSVTQYNEMISELGRAKTDVKKLQSEKEISLKEKTIIEEEIAKEISDYENEKAILEKEINNLELQKGTMLHSMRSELGMNKKMLTLNNEVSDSNTDNEEKGNIIRAEKSGAVSELYFRNRGEYVLMSDLLCTIVPEDSPLYMDVVVANKDIGFIEKDMQIKYKFDAFPYTDYGIVRGNVVTVSPSAVEDQTKEFVYHVHGSLDQQSFKIKDKQYPIKAGMTATAELVKERKNILSILIGKLKK
ncbi:MAG: HlyD family efflux transporter periplasmic adaptor subunit [Candidatus Latescibacteria bacterium]|nr:HlyD family efflux transporter periplasmic adaptor subunit [Candidatus Latescibacterota bacterium]